MRTPAQLPSPFDGHPFQTKDALAMGVSLKRLRAKDLSSPNRGIRSPRALNSVRERAEAFSLVMGPLQYFSHVTAAELLGLRLPSRRFDPRLHVTSIAPMRATRTDGVLGHQTALLPLLYGDGVLTMSHPLQALLDCSVYLSIDELVALGDGLLARKNPMTDFTRLDAAINYHRGRRGYTRLLAARPQMRARSDSARETQLRLMLERAGLPEPEVNGEIRDAHGRLVAHGDLYYRDFRTVVEYDGEQHRLDDRQFTIDVQRIDAIMELGLRHIRVDKALFAQPTVVIAKVGRALSTGGWRGTIQPS